MTCAVIGAPDSPPDTTEEPTLTLQLAVCSTTVILCGSQDFWAGTMPRELENKTRLVINLIRGLKTRLEEYSPSQQERKTQVKEDMTVS